MPPMSIASSTVADGSTNRAGRGRCHRARRLLRSADCASGDPIAVADPAGLARHAALRAGAHHRRAGRKVGLTFEPPGLVQRILDEAGEDEGMLPLLEYALKETWGLRKGNTMTGDSYARSGGVRKPFGSRRSGPLRRFLLRIGRPRVGLPSAGDAGRRARGHPCPCGDALEPAQRKIVEQFAGPRTRLLVTGSDRAARPTVEVAHEALIRTWPRLRGWIDANREKLRARAAVLQAKADGSKRQTEDMLLPAGLLLERARALLPILATSPPTISKSSSTRASEQPEDLRP